MAKWESDTIVQEKPKWENDQTVEQREQSVDAVLNPISGQWIDPSLSNERANRVFKTAEKLNLPLGVTDQKIVEPEEPLTVHNPEYWIKKGYSPPEAQELAQPSQDDLAAKLYSEETFFNNNSILPATYKGALTATSRFLYGIEDVANLIGNRLRLTEPQKGGLFRKLGNTFAEKADFWEKVLRDRGASGLEELVGEVAGGFVPGAYEFAMGVPYAFATGAAQAEKRGDSAIIGGTKSAVNRYILGKLLDVFSMIKNPYIRRSLGSATFGIDTALAGGSPADIGVQSLLGFFLTGYHEKSKFDNIEKIKIEKPIEESGAEKFLPEIKGISRETFLEPAPKEGGEVSPQNTAEAKPAQMTPIGTGAEKISRLALGVEAKAIENKLVESIGDLPKYNVLSMAEQAQKAGAFLKNEPQKARNIAMGNELPPTDILPESVFVAVENEAVKNGDIQTIKDLAHSTLATEATAMGQRIRTLGERQPHSPVTVIKDVIRAREKAIAKKSKENLDTVKGRIKNEMLDSIRKTGSKRQDWASFIENIRCN